MDRLCDDDRRYVIKASVARADGYFLGHSIEVYPHDTVASQNARNITRLFGLLSDDSDTPQALPVLSQANSSQSLLIRSCNSGDHEEISLERWDRRALGQGDFHRKWLGQDQFSAANQSVEAMRAESAEAFCQYLCNISGSFAPVLERLKANQPAYELGQDNPAMSISYVLENGGCLPPAFGHTILQDAANAFSVAADPSHDWTDNSMWRADHISDGHKTRTPTITLIRDPSNGLWHLQHTIKSC